MNEIIFKSPSNQIEFKEYDLFRWEILRKPIGKDITTLKDKYEESAFHLIGVINKKIIACGRLHFNNRDEAIGFYETSGYKTTKIYNGSDTGIPHTSMRKNLPIS